MIPFDKSRIKDLISEFEIKAGESFTDYFMHSQVSEVAWAYFLMGKGHDKRANAILNLLDTGETCLDQSLLFEINSAIIEDDLGDSGEHYIETLGVDKHKALYNKDIDLWAEFISKDVESSKRVKAFFENHGLLIDTDQKFLEAVAAGRLEYQINLPQLSKPMDVKLLNIEFIDKTLNIKVECLNDDLQKTVRVEKEQSAWTDYPEYEDIEVNAKGTTINISSKNFIFE